MEFAALRNRLTGLQSKLGFETWSPTDYPQFASKMVRSLVFCIFSTLMSDATLIYKLINTYILFIYL